MPPIPDIERRCRVLGGEHVYPTNVLGSLPYKIKLFYENRFGLGWACSVIRRVMCAFLYPNVLKWARL